MDSGGASSGDEVVVGVVVLVLVVVVVGYWWWCSGGGVAGDRICKGRSCNSCGVGDISWCSCSGGLMVVVAGVVVVA